MGPQPADDTLDIHITQIDASAPAEVHVTPIVQPGSANPVDEREQVLDALPLNAEDAAMAELAEAVEDEREVMGSLRLLRNPETNSGGAGMVMAGLLGGMVGGAIYGAIQASNQADNVQDEIGRSQRLIAERRQLRSGDPAQIAAVQEAVAARQFARRSAKKETVVALIVFLSILIASLIGLMVGVVLNSVLTGLMIGGVLAGVGIVAAVITMFCMKR